MLFSGVVNAPLARYASFGARAKLQQHMLDANPFLRNASVLFVFAAVLT